MENQQPTTTNLPVVTPAEEIKAKIPALLEANLPKIIKWHKRADEELDSIQPIPEGDDDAYEEANASLAAVRDVYTAINGKRTEITEITDKLKSMLMDYERPFNPAYDKSKYNEKRKLLEQYQQAKHDKIMREKQEAAKRKELENYKIDLRARILNNLSEMLIERVRLVDTGSRDWFAGSTVETFDDRARLFSSQEPHLKKTAYEQCFVLQFDANVIQPDDAKALISDVISAEPYAKWDKMFIEQAAPIINEWRAKIPDMKAQVIEVAELEKKNKAEADALKAKQKEESDRQAQERQKKLDEEAAVQKAKIQEEAELGKMSNNFAAQAVTQDLGDAGKTKLVLKFVKPETSPKAFIEILYHSMSHPDFPGFQRRDSKKKLMVDDKGRPIYIEPVQWWIDFFLDKCDAHIEGTVVTEDAKITIRK